MLICLNEPFKSPCSLSSCWFQDISQTPSHFSLVILVVRFLLLKSVRFLCEFIHFQDSPNDDEANVEGGNDIRNESDFE